MNDAGYKLHCYIEVKKLKDLGCQDWTDEMRSRWRITSAALRVGKYETTICGMPGETGLQ
jgi:hypothetical protein